VTRYLLDTNILSETLRPQPAEGLLHWMEAQADAALCIAALTLAELRRGILLLPRGRRRTALQAWFEGEEGPPRLFAGRILSFDHRAALRWAELMAEGQRLGRPRSALDMIIAATAEAHGCMIVTANARDFWGLPVLDPVRGPSR
jgi:predicted nucleic acid-binding protein